MKPKYLLAATVMVACVSVTPAAAQSQDPMNGQRVVVIERDSDTATADGKRKVKVMRVVERETTDADVEAVEKVEVRVIRMGKDADLSEEELAAIAKERLDDDKMVVFSAREMECERTETGTVKLKVCSSEGKADVLDALRKARAEVAAETSLEAEQRDRALVALDRRIAELESGTGD